MGVQGGLGVLKPRGRAQGDVPSLRIIDRRPDKLHDFISLRVCCDLLKYEEDGCWEAPAATAAGAEASLADAGWLILLLEGGVRV